MPGKKRDNYTCSCGKNVTKTQSSIGCFLCGGFFHISCVKVSQEQHRLFCQNKNIFRYVCENCSAPTKENNTNSSVSATNIQQELHNISVDIGQQFDEHNRIFEKQIQASIAVLENKMLELFDRFKAEQEEKVNKIINDKLCYLQEHENTVMNKRLTDMEHTNSVLQRRLNRSNIIVRGLPRNIKDLRVPILKIASLCGFSLAESDLQHCAYIYKGGAVLVKMNSVHQRDQIMINFSKCRYFLLKDIIGGDITSKVFLFDHLTPAASKLLSICKNLRASNKITKYRYINLDVPKVKITLPNQVEKVVNTDECLDILHNEQNVNENISNNIATESHLFT